MRVALVIAFLAPLGVPLAAQGTMAPPVSDAKVSGHSSADSAQALLNFILTANRDAIVAARMVSARSSNASTRSYAQRVIDDHTKSIAVWTAKAPALSLTVEDSSKATVQALGSAAGRSATANGMAEVRDTTTAMRGGMSAAALHSTNVTRLVELQKLSGAAFDTAYLKDELAMQNAILKELDAHPTTYTELQSLLTQFRSMIEDHRPAVRKLLGDA